MTRIQIDFDNGRCRLRLDTGNAQFPFLSRLVGPTVTLSSRLTLPSFNPAHAQNRSLLLPNCALLFWGSNGGRQTEIRPRCFLRRPSCRTAFGALIWAPIVGGATKPASATKPGLDFFESHEIEKMGREEASELDFLFRFASNMFVPQQKAAIGSMLTGSRPMG